MTHSFINVKNIVILHGIKWFEHVCYKKKTFVYFREGRHLRTSLWLLTYVAYHVCCCILNTVSDIFTWYIVYSKLHDTVQYTTQAVWYSQQTFNSKGQRQRYKWTRKTIFLCKKPWPTHQWKKQYKTSHTNIKGICHMSNEVNEQRTLMQGQLACSATPPLTQYNMMKQQNTAVIRL